MQNTPVTINIPTPLYQRAQKMAQAQKKDVSEILAASIQLDPPPYTWTEASENTENERIAFLGMHQTLWEKYPLEHVAIYQGELVDHDSDGEALSLRIYQKYPDQFVLIRQVTVEAEPVLHFRSPRFIRDSE